ncbi:hypothetical protein [Lacinutrix jangbogonensis]|uniref:hypothetical protein n=1 Tax=Lacinutrix jangbogonensis TaxID=1469557 RepID=UPI000A808072|nr:hypothetical protein [Lacinutrix jangbogonensis]
MNTNKLRSILYFIILIVISTIAIQVYWNYKNYQTNKQQLVNDVQVSLDNAVNTYYENLAKKTTLNFIIDDLSQSDFFKVDAEFKTLIKEIDINSFKNTDSMRAKSNQGVTIIHGSNSDSLLKSLNEHNHEFNINDTKSNNLRNELKDSSKLKNFKSLASKVIISINNDSIKLRDIDSLLKVELIRKALVVNYSLTFKRPEKNIQSFNALPEKNMVLLTTSKSTFLPQHSQLKVHFKNDTKFILKRILGGILISTLLVLAVISCLFYLLKIINQQKK